MTEETKTSVRQIPQERRRFVRVRKEVELSCNELQSGRSTTDISTRNLCIEGLQITLRKQLPVGTMLTLRASMDEGRVGVAVPARLVWCEYNAAASRFEAGVELVGIDAVHRRNIMSLIGKSLTHEGMERRHYIRLPRRLLTDHRSARGIFRLWKSGYTRDISVGGVGLVTKAAVKDGSALNLRIHLDDNGQGPLLCSGTVIEHRTDADTGGLPLVAMRFEGMDEESRRRLGAYITQALNSKVILPGRGVATDLLAKESPETERSAD